MKCRDCINHGICCKWEDKQKGGCTLFGEWIPVSKRLPKESGLYLVTVRLTFSKDDKFVSVNDSDDWELLEKCGNEVIAWMPLPKPYMAESEE